MQEITISEWKKLSKKTRSPRRIKPKQQRKLTEAERTAAIYLQALYPDWMVMYELGKIRLRGSSYTPDLVCISPDAFDRIYVEVKEGRKAGKWHGFRIRETMVKLNWLKEKVEPWGHRVILLTVEKGRVVKEQEIA